jgi:nucleoid DNA-binding protein
LEQNTITQAQLVEFLAERHDIPKAKALRILQSLEDYITVVLAEGDRVRLGRIGIFESVLAEARVARNPITGETLQVPEKRRVRFRAAAELKREINRA